MAEKFGSPRLWFIIYRHPVRSLIARVFYASQAGRLPPHENRLVTITNHQLSGPILKQIDQMVAQAAAEVSTLDINPDEILWIKNY